MTVVSSHASLIYTFSYFKIHATIFKRMDDISREFWWGHEPNQRKLHLLNWDTTCSPKGSGGLGLKKISLINKAMLTKQYWRMVQQPNSIFSKTFKARYLPKIHISDSKPKPHHSWIWRNIAANHNPILTKGRWVIGKGNKQYHSPNPSRLVC